MPELAKIATMMNRSQYLFVASHMQVLRIIFSRVSKPNAKSLPNFYGTERDKYINHRFID